MDSAVVFGRVGSERGPSADADALPAAHAASPGAGAAVLEPGAAVLEPG